jgi:hypothetical protein
MREKFILNTPYRQVVFTIPKMLRIFFKFNRSLLSELCVCGKEALMKYLKITTEKDITPGIIAMIQSFGGRIIFRGIPVQQILGFCGNIRFNRLGKKKLFNESVFPIVVFAQINPILMVNQKTVDNSHMDLLRSRGHRFAHSPFYSELSVHKSGFEESSRISKA